MIFTSIITSCIMIHLPMSLCTNFPEVVDSEHVNVRLRNVASKSYLNVMKNKEGAYELGTKANASLVDPDVDFSLFYFTSAEMGETKLGLIRHQETGMYINMDHDKRVQLSLGMGENPLELTKADNRFFFIHKDGEHFAFNYLSDDGFRHTYYLAVNGSNVPVFRKKTNLSNHYPADILFSIEQPDLLVQ